MQDAQENQRTAAAKLPKPHQFAQADGRSNNNYVYDIENRLVAVTGVRRGRLARPPLCL